MAVLLRGGSAAATATTAGPSALLATTFRRAHGRLMPRASRPRRFCVARASAQPLEVCAKESATVPGHLGDCPFTQRVLLTIEEKHLPYDLKLVDLANKPDWLFEINSEGKVPIVKLEDQWIADSDVITQTLEEKYPEPPLATPPEKASVGSKIFSTFIGFLKSKDPSDGTEEALLNELSSLDSYLKDNVSGLLEIVILHECLMVLWFCTSFNISTMLAAPFRYKKLALFVLLCMCMYIPLESQQLVCILTVDIQNSQILK
ncbi:hypothetical protein BS78_10G098500 [Paspalum vaginatum]|nr:hypothetical protein BS78_10G098500 [Paspalum vaginatum]